MATLIHWKEGVRARDLRLVMRPALMMVYSVYTEMNRRMTVTCTGDGDHTPTSLHPWGYAFDVRIRDMSISQRQKAYRQIKAMFTGTPYQVILHSTHIHIEYDPPDWKTTW